MPFLAMLLQFSLGAFSLGEFFLDPLPVTSDRAEQVPQCVDYRAEARLGAYGYNHLVHIRNRCSISVDCVVSTDVNPAPTAVHVGPGEVRTVVTFRESPARVFVARVTCRFENEEG